MPMPRGSSEISQHQSPRLPLHIRTTASSEANRSTDRKNPKVSERRAQRGPYHHDENKRQCRTRVSDLAKKLAEAQEELKKLTEQLAATEAAKKDTQQELENTKRKIPIPRPSSSSSSSNVIKDEKSELQTEESFFSSSATDVFELVPTTSIQTNDSEEAKSVIEEEGEGKEEELHKRYVEITELNEKIEALAIKNIGLQKQVEEAKEIDTKLVKLEVELRNSETKVASLEEKVEVLEGAKEGLEEEMKKLRAQADQWRKAAEEAAVVLSAGYEGNNGGAGFVGSPELGGGGGGRRRGGGGMKMFGELWKKMGQK